MLFFNESADYLTETVEDIETPFEASSEGITEMMSEASEEWYNLRERMMRLEHTAIVSEDMNLLSEGVGDFFTKIINFFKKMWAHLKAILQKFWNKVMQFIATDKQFLKSYEDKYRDATAKEIKGYNFIAGVNKTTELIITASGVVAEVRNSFPMGEPKDISEWKKEEKFDQLRGKIAGGSSVKSTSFRLELIKKCTGNTQKIDFTPSKDAVISILKDGKNQIKSLQNMRKKTDEQYAQIIKYFKAASSKVGGAKSGSDVKVMDYHRNDYGASGTRKNSIANAHDANDAGHISDGSVVDRGTHTVKAGNKNASYYSDAAAAIKKAVAIFNATVGACIAVINASRGEARKAVIAAVNGKITSDTKERFSESAGFSILDQF